MDKFLRWVNNIILMVIFAAVLFGVISGFTSAVYVDPEIPDELCFEVALISGGTQVTKTEPKSPHMRLDGRELKKVDCRGG